MGFNLPGKSIQAGTSGHSSALKMKAEADASALKQKAKTYDQAYEDMGFDPSESSDTETIYRKKDKYGKVYGAKNTKTEDKGRAEFTKAAKAWNMKTYGTHNPTADAKKAGMTKKELAAKHKASKTTTVTPEVKTTVDPVKEEKTPRVEKTKYVDKDKSKTVYRKDGSVKKKVYKNIDEDDGRLVKKDKTTYRKDGGKKKYVRKEKDSGFNAEGKYRTRNVEKYDKEGNVKRSKYVDVRGGRRTVTKTNKKGETKTRSRRTLKGILTGKGKLDNDEKKKRKIDQYTEIINKEEQNSPRAKRFVKKRDKLTGYA